MKKYKVLLASLLAVLIAGVQAQAVSIKGRAISTIDDILRYARGLGNVSAADTNLNLSRASVLRLHDDGQMDLQHNISSGSRQNLSLGQIRGYLSEGRKTRDNSFSQLWRKRTSTEIRS